MKQMVAKRNNIKPVALVVLLAVAHAAGAFADDRVEQKVIDAPAGAGVKLWPSPPPADCPFKASVSFSGRLTATLLRKWPKKSPTHHHLPLLPFSNTP